MMIVKTIILYFWNAIVNLFICGNTNIHLIIDFIYRRLVQAPKVASLEDSVNYIIQTHCSVSRLGDGEIKLVAGKKLGFQDENSILQEKMIEVLSKPIENHIVCLPDIFNDLTIYDSDSQKHWKKHLAFYRRYWYRYINKQANFYNAFISRCYMMYQNPSMSSRMFELLKQIWQNRDVIIIEGEQSRLGVNNDLFNNTKSIKRILAPNRNAFNYYQLILDKVTQYDKQEYLILLALGPTATVMAYDLAKLGYQAIDIGHVDIEYEWFLMKATHKVPVHNKFVNEAGAGAGVGICNDQMYLSQILFKIG
jgi:glycosyltransferase family protein